MTEFTVEPHKFELRFRAGANFEFGDFELGGTYLND